MKILVLNGNTTAAVTERMIAALKPICPESVHLVGATAPFGLPYVSIRPVQAWLAWWLAMAVAAALTWRSLPVGEDRVLEHLRHGVAPKDLIGEIIETALPFCKGTLHDDLAMAALRRL